MNSPISHLAQLLAAEHDASVRETSGYRAAVEAMEADPALQAAFTRERAFAARHPRLLPEARFPEARIPGLLAEMQVLLDEVPDAGTAAPMIPFKSRRTWTMVAALAAAFVLGVFVSPRLFSAVGRSPVVAASPSLQPDSFRQFASNLVAQGFELDHQATEPAAVEAWLAARNVPATLPKGSWAARPAIGCKVLEWQGRPAVIVCYRVDNGEVVHLLVSDLTCASVSEGCIPQWKVVGSRQTALWRKNGVSYLAIADGPEQPLDKALLE